MRLAATAADSADILPSFMSSLLTYQVSDVIPIWHFYLLSRGVDDLSVRPGCWVNVGGTLNSGEPDIGIT